MTEIAKILKIIRTEHDISMQGMADMLGVSRPYLSMIETGKNPMPEDWIYKLQEAFHIPEEKIAALQQLVCTREGIQLFPNNDAKRELVLTLARRLNDLKDAEVAALQSLLEQDT